MTIQTPMKAVQGNLILNQFDEMWAYYRLRSTSLMEFDDKKNKWSKKTKWNDFWKK